MAPFMHNYEIELLYNCRMEAWRDARASTEYRRNVISEYLVDGSFCWVFVKVIIADLLLFDVLLCVFPCCAPWCALCWSRCRAVCSARNFSSLSSFLKRWHSNVLLQAIIVSPLQTIKYSGRIQQDLKILL